MIIKKYIVRDMSEAMRKARNEMGEEAVIVTQRSIRDKGPLGLFKPKKLEVTMAVEESEQKTVRQNRTYHIDKESMKDKPMEEIQELPENKEENEKLDYLLTRMKDTKEYQALRETQIYGNLEESRMLPVLVEHYLKDQLEEEGAYSNLIHEHCIAFVGSTGVGKTTTIAKIAAYARVQYGKSVGFITIDTYRIGAVEQLKIYGEIMDIPLEKVSDPEEMTAAIQKFSDRDLILIDTLGTSHRNKNQLNTIDKYLNEGNQIVDIKKAAVFSATMEMSVFDKALEIYHKTGIDYLIMTKLDEMENPAKILDYLEHMPVPLSHLCTGQTVPDDLVEAGPKSLFHYLWEEVSP